ncbi:MAG: hypothetical protein ACFCVG_04250 [Kineosporiaceae bacterium]
MDVIATAAPHACGQVPDWSAWERRYLPEGLRAGALPATTVPEDRRSALRTLVSWSGFDGLVRAPAGLAERLLAVMTWARADVPLALLAAGHAYALDLLDRPSPAWARPGTLWAVWLPDGEPSALSAEAGGPVYRLSGVVARPVGGGLVTHAVVAADGAEGRLLFAADLSHPRVQVMSNVSPERGCPVEFSGAYRFEDAPATPLMRQPPSRRVLRRLLDLSTAVLVVGAAAGVVHGTAGQAVPGPSSAAGAVDALAARVPALAVRVERSLREAGDEASDSAVAEFAGQVRATAAGILAEAARLTDPGAARRAGQLEVVLRLGGRTY